MKASFFMIRLPMAIMCVLLVSHHIAAASGSEDTANLWSDLVRQYDNPQEKIFDEWNVVTGVTLVKTAKGIPSGHALLAGILKYLESSSGNYVFRFSKGDRRVFIAILEHFKDEINKNEDFVAGLNRVYESYIEDLDPDSDYLKGHSLSQMFAADLVKLSKNPEMAARTYLSQRLYNPFIKTEVSADIAKAFLDCGLPFVLTRKGKSLLCIGYASKNGKALFIVADNENVKQGEMSSADLVLGTGEWAQISRERARERDAQFGLLKIDAEFDLADAKPDGISFVEIMGEDRAFTICSMPPGDSEIIKFIKKNKKNIDEVIEFIND